MTQVARHQVGTVTITRTRFTFLVTIEHAATGQQIDHLRRAWPTEEAARTMARNAYRFYSLALAA